MRNLTLLNLFALILFFSNVYSQSNTSDIFISEYCEWNHTVAPEYYNHYIELYNGTGSDVDLSDYQLWRAMNGAGWNYDVNNATQVDPLTLSGTLADGQTYVITRPNEVATPTSIGAYSDITWSFLNISGDDAIGLAKKTTGDFELIDLIGDPDVDPGTAWTVAGVSDATQNNTIVRKSNVCSPSIDWSTASISEWTPLGENVISNIDMHTCTCGEEVAYSDTLRALFIGNSYTYYNDMPTMVGAIASSVNEIIITDQHTIGGYTWIEHSTNATTIAKIQQGGFDYVVLQDQSLALTKEINTVNTNSYSPAIVMDNMIHQYNSCAQTVFYNTWGRKNGSDGLTYEAQDDLLAERYEIIADSLSGLISPVGQVRRYLRTNHPSIELYDPDNSHPSAAGSYVSAICFYTVFSRHDPTLVSYNFNLSSSDADAIKQAAKIVLYNNFQNWNVGLFDHQAPTASFDITDNIEGTITLDNSSINADRYYWEFGDNTTSLEFEPSHTYVENGTYSITLTASYCSLRSSVSKSIDTYSTVPVISDVQNIPFIPKSSETTMISAIITDDFNVVEAVINWGTSYGELNNQVVMTNDGNVYSGVIPAQADQATVYYQLSATDDDSNITINDEMEYLVSNSIIWNSYEMQIGSGLPMGTVTSAGIVANMDFYESSNDGGVEKGTSLTYVGTHNDAFNNVKDAWGTYPYVGKSSVGRGGDDGEYGAVDPLGVEDMQMHPPSNNHLCVASFEVPVIGSYNISGIGLRRVHSSTTFVTLRVFNENMTEISTTTSNSQEWVYDDNSYALGSLAEGDLIYFAVDAVDGFNFDAAEISWKIEMTDISTLVQSYTTNSFKLFPNPSDKGIVNISSEEDIVKLSVVDMQGRTIQRLEPQKSFFQFKTIAMPSGIYFVKIHFDTGTLTKKFIVQ